MKPRILDCVALLADLPDSGLRAGDVGTIVEVYSPNTFEVEFIAEDGDTNRSFDADGEPGSSADQTRAEATSCFNAPPIAGPQ